MADAELERLKVYQDSFKHMMTFSSAAIGVASAVTGALFLPKPDYPKVLAASILLLASGALFAMLGFVVVPRRIASGVSTGELNFIDTMLWASVTASYMGVALFSFFAGANLLA